MILIQSDIKDDGFDVLCKIRSEDAGGELAAILKVFENEHPHVLAQALDHLMDRRMRAFIYGSEVAILDFYLARKHGTPYCSVRILESGIIEKVPTSCIEIRR